MSLTAAAISARAPERRLQTLLDEFYKLYFTGVPHFSPLGDVTFPLVDLLFNQAQLPDPEAKPQLHIVFTGWRTQETWWIGGRLQTWRELLSTPASGVNYGRTEEGNVEESVHGLSVRRLPGINIRWRNNAGTYVEEVFDSIAWNIVRTFPSGTTALRWIRDSGNYLEQANVSGTWTLVRTIAPAGDVWDGTKVLITGDVELSHFVRAAYSGDDIQRTDFLVRTVAANVEELLRDGLRTADLSRKGIRHLQIRSGPRVLPTEGYASRLLVATTQLHWYLPKEGL